MNYKKHYIKLIRKAQNRELPKEVCVEKHHIFPKSIFGKNKILVKLTPKEHFIAHILLWKYYKQKYGTKDQKTIKMLYSVNYMIHIQNTTRIDGSINKKKNSRIYAKLRREFSKNMSLFQKEYHNRPEIKEKIREFHNRPEIKEKKSVFQKEYQNRLEIKEKTREFQNRPEVKEKMREFQKEYQNRPEVKERKRESKRHKMRAVERTDPNTGEVKEYESLHAVEKDGFCCQLVWKCCNNKVKTHKRIFLAVFRRKCLIYEKYKKSL